MLVDFLRQNPGTYVVVAGFADSIGDEEFNLGLSERRAESVESALTNAGADGDRGVTLWFDELNLVADNTTEEGRQLNRRVENAVFPIIGKAGIGRSYITGQVYRGGKVTGETSLMKATIGFQLGGKPSAR
jgi:hypothetical protein